MAPVKLPALLRRIYETIERSPDGVTNDDLIASCWLRANPSVESARGAIYNLRRRLRGTATIEFADGRYRVVRDDTAV